MYMYFPKIRDDQVRSLYQLKEKTRIPMTRLIQEALDQFLDCTFLQRVDALKDYVGDVSEKGKPKNYDTPLESLLWEYEQQIQHLEKENKYLRTRQEELIEFSEEWLAFKESSDDIKWFAVKVLKELKSRKA